MTKSRRFAIAAAALALLAAGWWLVSPWWSLRGMKAAAEAGDAAAFADYVDFPALRDDMKAELRAQLVAEARARGGAAAAAGAAFAAAFAGPAIDAFVTPEGVRAAFVAGAAHRAAGSPGAAAFDLGDDPDVTRRGVNEFLLHRADRPDTGLVFTRHGLGWKLSGIELAPSAPSPAR